MIFSIFTLGCKTNQYESELMRESLLEKGYVETNFKEFANVYIINSCVVTEKAERETRKAVNEALAKNPNALVVLTGCFTNLHKEYKDKRVVLYRGARKKISSFIETGVEEAVDFERIENFFERARAFVKIEEGCDNFCTYCIVPVVRGYKIRSKDEKNIVDEIKGLVDRGYKEVVLTGTEIGKYGKDTGTSLAKLVNKLKRIEGLGRLRISSIHPKYVTDELISEFIEPYVLQPHLHISLQSGDNEVLKQMNRGYTREDYLRIVEKLRNIDPDFSISTDVIVGFPFETETAFFNTLTLIKNVQFSKVHVFRYSKRPFTPAFYFKENILESVKSTRSKRVIEFANEISIDYKKRFVNKVVPVLVEEVKDGFYWGFSPHYIKVSFPQEAKLNKIALVKIEAVFEDHIEGSLVTSK